VIKTTAIEQCFTSPPTQYISLYGRRFLQVKRPNQQYQSTEGKEMECVFMTAGEYE